jgi:transcriptional regulator with XRE-family HTH domain
VVGIRLKEERERLGLTQPEFAEIAGAKKRTVIDWQNGASSPTAVQLAALAGAGVDIAYVITGFRAKAHRKLAAVGQAADLLQKAGAPDAVGRELMPALVELLSEEGALSPQENQLVADYRSCTAADQDVIRQMAARFAGDATVKPAKKTRTKA